MAASVANRPRFLGVAATSALCIGSAEAAGNAEVFDLWIKLKSFEYTVVRHLPYLPELNLEGCFQGR